MGKKTMLYDEKGNEVFFDFPIDAREAVATGRYTETFDSGSKPEKAKAKEVKVEEPKVDKKLKPIEEDVEDFKDEIEA
jgi:hypothetical protein